MELYSGPGQRRILPPLVFGAGVLWHLLRHGRRYDVVHTCSFPYFSLLAAALVAPARRYRIAVDWFEVWSPRATGGSTWAGSQAGLAGGCRGSARGCRSGRSASRSCTRVACATRACAARSRCWPAPTQGPRDAAAEPRRRAARGVRRPPHPGEAGPGDRAGDRSGAAPVSRSCAALILGDGPERELVDARGARPRPGRRHRGARVRGHGGGRGRHRSRPVPAAALSP